MGIAQNDLPKGLLLTRSGSLIPRSHDSAKSQFTPSAIPGVRGPWVQNSWVAIPASLPPATCHRATGIQWIQVGCMSQPIFLKDGGELPPDPQLVISLVISVG